jgi:hypothetical protein
MGQIDGHHVSLGHRVACGQAPELISYIQTHEMIKPFWYFGYQDFNIQGSLLLDSCIPGARNPKRTRTVDQEVI